MKHSIIIIVLALAPCSRLCAQDDASSVRRLLDQAAERFDVPKPVLYGIAFTESRWRNIPGNQAEPCSGMPRSHGVMGLRDDQFFGRSLGDGEMLGITAAQADTDLVQNITVGAHRLSQLFRGMDRRNIAQWYSAIGNYPGIPREPLRRLYLDGVIELLRRGWMLGDVAIPPLNVPSIDKAKLRDDLRSMGVASFAGDYPEAVWMPSPNYSSRAGTPVTAITIHDTEGNFAGSVAWLSDTAAQASAHYVIRSIDGYIVQLVRESNKAWHIRTENPYTIGIEHEGYVAKPEFFTPALYGSSSRLVRYLKDKYNVPLDRTHIKGHLDFPNNTHTDPGGWWDWPGYYRLVSGDGKMRVVLDPFEDNVVGWWQPGMSGSTTGIDTAGTRFDVVPDAARTGSAGGRLSYAFTAASGGMARVFRSGHGNVSDGLLYVGKTGFVTLSVRGDGSGHQMEMWFYDSTKANFTAPIGAVDWTGWRTVAIDVSKLGGKTGMRFHSLALRQTAGKKLSGEIAVDDLAHEIQQPILEVEGEGRDQMGEVRGEIVGDEAFAKWTPSAGVAEIVMCDALGVQVFVRSVRAGDGEAAWDVSRLPSGAYFIRVRVGMQTRVMRAIKSS